MSQETRNYSLDKTVFQAMKVEDADNHVAYWKKKTLKERLDAACYLIPIDKTVFAKRKHAH